MDEAFWRGVLSHPLPPKKQSSFVVEHERRIMKNQKTGLLVSLALLVAMEVILNRFLSINAWNLKIGFAFVPVAIAAIMYGPVAGGIVGALGDFTGAILFPIGPYFPGFTLTSFLMGLVYGFFIHKKQDIKRISIAVCINQLILGFILNSFWISFLYGSPYLPLLGTRIIQCAILIPVQITVIKLLDPVIHRIGKVIEA